MKKWTIFVAILVLTFALTACGSNKDSSTSNNDSKQSASQDNSLSSAQQKVEKQMQDQINKGLVDDSKTVAVVNGTKIPGKQYNLVYKSVASQLFMTSQQQGSSSSNSNITKQAKQQALNSLVGQQLILQDAKSKGYKATDDKVKSQYDDFEKQYGGKDKLQSALMKQNMSIADLKESISEQIIFKQYTDKEIDVPKVTDDEIKQFYDQYSKSLKNAPKLDDIKSQIKQQLQQQKQDQALSKRVDQLKKGAMIDIKI